MKAIYTTKETKNGTRYIYKLDGKQVRTSMRKYEHVCIKTNEVESSPVCFGKLATCEQPIAKNAAYIRDAEIHLDYYRGNITYAQYLSRMGRKNPFALTPGGLKEHKKFIEEHYNTTPEAYYTERIAIYKDIKFEILTFVQE